MTLLRVLLQGVPRADQALPWALFDDAGKRVSEGEGTPAQWPDAGQREALLDAGSARVIALVLPPLPPARLAAAVRFALDDQLAAPGESLHVAITRQDRDGRVRAVVVEGALRDALRNLRPAWARVLALPTLRSDDDGDWHWLDSPHRCERFLARGDGSALAAEDPSGSEVMMALRDARQRGQPVARVVAHGLDAATLQGIAARTQTAWVAAPPWRWTDASPESFDHAVDLFAATGAHVSRTDRRAALSRALRPATWLAAAALVVFALGLAGTWAYARFEAWRDDRAVVALARDAGIGDADSAPAAVAAIAARYRDAMHARGSAAPDDAWPLLATIAPALTALPRGTLRRAIYNGGAWTFELAPLEAPARTALERAATAAGVTALTAAGTNGLRMRVTP